MFTFQEFMALNFAAIFIFGTLNSLRRDFGRGMLVFWLCANIFGFACVIVAFVRPLPYDYDSFLFYVQDIRLLLLLVCTEAFVVVMLCRECLLLVRKRRSTLKTNP